MGNLFEVKNRKNLIPTEVGIDSDSVGHILNLVWKYKGNFIIPVRECLYDCDKKLVLDGHNTCFVFDMLPLGIGGVKLDCPKKLEGFINSDKNNLKEFRRNIGESYWRAPLLNRDAFDIPPNFTELRNRFEYRKFNTFGKALNYFGIV